MCKYWDAQTVVDTFFKKKSEVWVAEFIILPKLFQLLTCTSNLLAPKKAVGLPLSLMYSKKSIGFSRGYWSSKPPEIGLKSTGKDKLYFRRTGCICSSALASFMPFMRSTTGHLATLLEDPAASSQAFLAHFTTSEQGTSAGRGQVKEKRRTDALKASLPLVQNQKCAHFFRTQLIIPV